MREPWSIPIAQAMQQHGGVSKEIAKSHDPSVKAERNCAASAPRETDQVQGQTSVQPAPNTGQR
jgi:hypothetical protein